MKIKLAHLYYDLLNLYGDEGNIIALRDSFKKQNVNLEVDYITVGSKIDFKKYDMFYIGSGSYENMFIVLNDILKYKKDIKKVIDNNKYFISTGNSKELFGKYFMVNNIKYDALGIFDYFAKENSSRVVGESVMEFNGLSPIIGFQNRRCVMQNNSNHLFSVSNGFADNFKSSYEGFHYNNFIGTYLIGPLLIRNPHFTDYIIKDILKDKYIESTNSYEYKAYEEYLKNFDI